VRFAQETFAWGLGECLSTGSSPDLTFHSRIFSFPGGFLGDRGIIFGTLSLLVQAGILVFDDPRVLVLLVFEFLDQFLLLHIVLEHLLHRGHKLPRVIQIVHVECVIVVKDNIWRLIRLQLPILLSIVYWWDQTRYIIDWLVLAFDFSAVKILETFLGR
jgi:hypothetical protein